MNYTTSIKRVFDNNFGNQYKEKWNRYLGTYSPIMYRKSVSPLKQDSQINISANFMSEIVNLKTGYLASKIVENINTENELLVQEWEAFKERNSEDVLNIENIKQSTTSGISHRLFYWKNGLPYIKVLYPWEVIYDYDDDIFTPTKAYHYFEKTDLLGKTKKYCDIYDSIYVTHTELKGGDYVQIAEPEVHLSNQVPIYPFLNNDNIQGNCDKVMALIDAYDESLSDEGSEMKASRFAYLKIFGDLYTGVDENGNEIQIPDYLREFGTLLFGLDDAGNKVGDAQFLEKNMNTEAYKSFRAELKKLIFEQSDSVDISEMMALGANTRIFTVKTALMRLETDCSVTERYMKRALEKQFSLWMNWVNNYLSITDDAYLSIEFNRSYIQDTESMISALVQLKGVLSLEDALNYLGFENARELAQKGLEELGATSGL